MNDEVEMREAVEIIQADASVHPVASDNNLRSRFHTVAEQEMQKLFDRVPMARQFHEGTWMDKEYYRRHVLETVLRIRLNNEVDAYSLYKIGYRDNKLAATLAKYLAEEYGHEEMFLRDLKQFGLDRDGVDASSPFETTKQLIGYMYLAINQDGPLPTMVWNWFVEWYSDRYNKKITQSAAGLYGDTMVRGTMAHIQYDESHDHDDLMWRTVERAVENWGNEDKALHYLRRFIHMIGDYFQELHDSTIGARAAG
jgi:hypothetical protein